MIQRMLVVLVGIASVSAGARCPALKFAKPASCEEGVDLDRCRADFEQACTAWLTSVAQANGQTVANNACPQRAQECAAEFVPIDLGAARAHPAGVNDTADLERVIDRASRAVRKNGKAIPHGKQPQGADVVSNNCNLVFFALGKELGVDGWARAEFGGPNATANDIHDVLTRCAGARCGRWTAISPDEAQRLANRGFVVVGAEHSVAGETHGHVAIVEPLPAGFDPSKLDPPAEPPFVRDGDQHHWTSPEKFFESTHGAVPAKRAFNHHVGDPLAASFFLYLPHPDDVRRQP